jgi:hypothetical protein
MIGIAGPNSILSVDFRIIFSALPVAPLVHPIFGPITGGTVLYRFISGLSSFFLDIVVADMTINRAKFHYSSGDIVVYHDWSCAYASVLKHESSRLSYLSRFELLHCIRRQLPSQLLLTTSLP